MAGYQCNLHEGPQAATHLHTSLETGATVAMCYECLPVGLIGALATELGLDPSGLFDYIRKYETRQIKLREQAAAKRAGTSGAATDSQGGTGQE